MRWRHCREPTHCGCMRAEFVCELLCKGVWGGCLSGGCCDNAAIKKSSLSRENEQHQEVSGREVERKVKLETETKLSGEARKKKINK